MSTNGNLYTSYLPKFSGNWTNSDNTGTFQLNVNYSESNTNSNISSHLLTLYIKYGHQRPYLLVKYAITKTVLVG